MEEPKRAPRTSDHATPTTLLLLFLFLLLSIAATLITSVSFTLSSGKPTTTSTTPTGGNNVSLIQTTCNKTFYPSLCHSTLSSSSSSSPSTTTTTTVTDVVNTTITHAIESTNHALIKIRRLPTPHHAAVDDCIYMLDQTTHVLHTAVRQLGLAHLRRRRSLRQIQNLLSAAMTHQDSCLTGFHEEETKKPRSHGLEKRLEKLLTPISQVLSNSLAITKQMEEEEEEPRSRGALRSRRVMIGKGRPRPDVVVSGDGIRGQFRTITDAVAAATKRRRGRFVIWIEAGVYVENVEIPAYKNNVVLVGAGMDRTVIAGNRNLKDGWTTFNSATLAVAGAGFLARDLTIINTSGPWKGQAVALRVSGDMAAFYRCNISGYQDTLYAHSLSQFYRECVVRGTVDFIFGNAAAVFQNCKVLVLTPMEGQRNMVTAQGRDDPNQPTGFSLQNCTVKAADESANSSRFETYLGRPWRRFSRTMVMGSYLGEVVSPKGWHEWSKARPLEGVELAEYDNRGPGSSAKDRVPWAHVNASREEAIQFAIGSLIGGRWLKATAYPFDSGL